MRKLTYLIIGLLCASTVFAQKSKVTGAQNYLTSGKIDKAKEAIDQGIKHEKCINWSKAYLVKGKVYQSIFESPLPAYKNLSDDALNIAFKAYMKCLELDVKGKMVKPVKAQMTNMIPNYTNQAVNEYNAGDFAKALNSFEQVLKIEKMDMFSDNPVIDTAVMFNAGMAAQKAANYPKAIEYYKKSVTYNYGGAKSYANLANVLKMNKQEDEAVKYLHKGFELYPNDSWMLVELINYYMLGGEPQKAAEYLDKAIALDPKNGSFYRAKGTLYEKTKEHDKAVEMYKKALELDPKDFTSLYNLGLLKLNEAIAHHKEVNEIADAKKYNTALKEVYAEYEAVIPYFEKVLEMQPNEKNSLITLKELYFKLRTNKPELMEKYNAVKAKLDKMQ
ncbi:MAG: tetratricopeptide repeat protein [Marinifilaceae bacterium]|jgi:tetratricopeptide (TPR) repeat protein|nr:tetratricopeptide repeat protein [Marinifilaceae bacterium]